MNRRTFLASTAAIGVGSLSGCILPRDQIQLPDGSAFIQSVEDTSVFGIGVSPKVEWKSLSEFPDGSLPSAIATENVQSGEQTTPTEVDPPRDAYIDFPYTGSDGEYRLYVFRETDDQPDRTWADDGGLVIVEQVRVVLQ